MRRGLRQTTVRRQFRTLRAPKGLTQRDVADRARITLARYWLLENAYKPTTPREARTLARIFGVTVDQIPNQVASR
jgi:transcriptional regulator with XRE-family HTH domain